MNRYVVLASDTNENYAFYAPLTCAVWRAFGFEPIMFLVGDWTTVRPAAQEALRSFKRVQVPAVEGLSTATVAQLVRIYACHVEGVQDDDFLLTSDVDMWPAGQWVGHVQSDLTLHLYNGAAYRDQPHPQYPMCYVGARAEAWRGIVGEGPLRTCLERATKDFNEARATWAPKDVAERTWDFDERYLGRLISQWQGGLTRKIARDMSKPGERRLDRSHWMIPTGSDGRANFDNYADVHLPRPGFGKMWPSIMPVLSKLLPKDQHDWARDYYAKWTGR